MSSTFHLLPCPVRTEPSCPFPVSACSADLQAVWPALQSGMHLTALYIGGASGVHKLDHGALSAIQSQTGLQSLRLSGLDISLPMEQCWESMGVLQQLQHLRLDGGVAALAFQPAFAGLVSLRTLQLAIECEPVYDEADPHTFQAAMLQLGGFEAGQEAQLPTHLQRLVATLTKLEVHADFNAPREWADALPRLPKLASLSLWDCDDTTSVVAGLGLRELIIAHSYTVPKLPVEGQWQHLTQLHCVSCGTSWPPLLAIVANALRDLALSCTGDVLNGRHTTQLLALERLSSLQLVFDEDIGAVGLPQLQLAARLQAQLAMGRPALDISFVSAIEYESEHSRIKS